MALVLRFCHQLQAGNVGFSLSVVGEEEIGSGIWVENTNNLGEDCMESFLSWSQLASYIISGRMVLVCWGVGSQGHREQGAVVVCSSGSAGSRGLCAMF